MLDIKKYRCPYDRIILYFSGERNGEIVYYCKRCREYYKEKDLTKWKKDGYK
jgi:hypothetical protein